MEELDKFCDFLFGDLQGYVYAPVKVSDTNWQSKFYHWPDEKQQLKDHITVASKASDVYLSPVVYSKKEAKKEAFKSSNVVWVEFDGVESISFKDVPDPNAIVQTSSDTHVHCYWHVGELSDAKLIEDINRRTTYYLEADSSGWDVTQLLRPPGTKNFKRGGLDVSLREFTKLPVGLKEFDAAPNVPIETIELTTAKLGDPEALLRELPILSSLRKKIKTEEVAQGSRSSFYYKIALELSESGCSHNQVATILEYLDARIGKFEGRSDRLHRISELASIAIHSVSQETESQVYTLEDVLSHTDELEWIWNKWLHTQGYLMVASAPGVGKTQLILQLSFAIVAGESSLLTPTNLKQGKCLIFSLEMDIRALQSVIRQQTPGHLGISQELKKNWLVVDEVSSFLRYEELIEEHRPAVVFFDSLLELAEDDVKDSEVTKGINRWIRKIRRKYNCAIVVIHHMRKASGSNKAPNTLDDVYGNVTIAKDVETGLVLYVPDQEKPDEVDLIVVKARFTKRETIEIVRGKDLLFEKRDASNEQPTDAKPLAANFEF